MSEIRHILRVFVLIVEKKMFRVIFLLFSILMVAACSDETQKVEDHVWKEQTDMIDTAKDVENLMNDAALQQRELIESNAQ